jgi:hypothetical protein
MHTKHVALAHCLGALLFGTTSTVHAYYAGGSICQPHEHADADYLSDGRVANPSTTTNRYYTCSLVHTYNGSATTRQANVYVVDNHGGTGLPLSNHSVGCQLFSHNYTGSSWSFSDANYQYAWSTGTGAQGITTGTATIYGGGRIGFLCTLPPKTTGRSAINNFALAM